MDRTKLSQAAICAEQSGVRRMFELARKYDDSINLTLGEPGFDTPDYIVDAAIKSLKAGKTKYTPNAGIKSLRDAIADKLKRENGISCDPDKNLIVTAGATQGIILHPDMAQFSRGAIAPRNVLPSMITPALIL